MSDLASGMPAPPPTAGAMAELFKIASRLTELLEAETRLLDAPGLVRLDPIGPEKSRLAARLDLLLRALKSVPPGEIAADPEAGRLKSALHQLDCLGRANARRLELRIAANRRVLEVIAKAARRATRPAFSYGTERLGYGVRGGSNAAIAVNRVL